MITKTALKRINWASYKINQSADKIGVFVSIVSTKIPYKGAGKEYIGTNPLPPPHKDPPANVLWRCKCVIVSKAHQNSTRKR